MDQLTWKDAACSITALIALILADVFPEYRLALRSFVGVFLFVVLYVGFRRPVNYRALTMDQHGFRHVSTLGGVVEARWLDIVDVYFVRHLDPFTNDYETEWEIHLASGLKLQILVEWAHRRKFTNALSKHVAGFLHSQAKAALSSSDEGRWHCYSPNDAFQKTPSAPLN